MGPFGSGKSVACCVEIMRRGREQAPNAEGVRKTRWAVVRNTYPDLKNTTVKTWKDWWGESFGPFNNVAPFVHHMRYDLNDGTKVDCEVIFLAMDDEKDAKKFLSLEVTGIYFNEVRELKKEVIDAGDARVGRYPSMKDGGPTWYGVIADTNYPDEDHWLYTMSEVERPEGWEFYHQPGGVCWDDKAEKWVHNEAAENIKNLPAGYYTDMMSGKNQEWITVYLAAQFGRLPTEGAYYAADMMLAERERRIGLFIPDAKSPVHTFWDIGRRDDTSIWFGQKNADQWRWIYFYTNRGFSVDHYAAKLKELAGERRWVYGDHVWPHDGGNTDWSSSESRPAVFEGLGFKRPIVLPRGDVGEGIDKSRRLMRRSTWDDEGCRPGLIGLRRYKRRFIAERNVYANEPLHDEHSHVADAYRTAADGEHLVSNDTAKWSDEILNFKFEYAG